MVENVITSQPACADTDVAMDAGPSTDQTATVQTQKQLSLSARFIAAFRGRTVHGVTVDLPEGYGGIILRATDDASVKEKVVECQMPDDRAKGKTRAKVSKEGVNRKAWHMDTDGDAGMDGNPDSQDPTQEDNSERGPVRTLNPSATFSSFVLWNPDLPVDEAKDEYLRSLTEWTKLAAQVSLPVVCLTLRI